MSKDVKEAIAELTGKDNVKKVQNTVKQLQKKLKRLKVVRNVTAGAALLISIGAAVMALIKFF